MKHTARARLATLVLWPAFVLLGGCSAIQVSASEEPFRAEDYATYAFWNVEPAEIVELDTEIRGAVEDELEELGLSSAEAAEADLLVTYRLSVESRQRVNDPYFEYYAAEEYEVGYLTVELRDRSSGEVAWSGTGTSELRLSRVMRGSLDTKLTPTDEDRDWRVAEKVAAIFERARE